MAKLGRKIAEALTSGKTPDLEKTAEEIRKLPFLPSDDASRMARAREMGFDTSRILYHGGPSGIEAFDKAKIGSNFGQDIEGFFFTNDPSDALGGAADYANRARREMGSGEVYPVHLRMNNPYTIEDYAKDLGADVDAVVLYAGEPQPMISIFDEDRNRIIDWAKAKGADGIDFTYTEKGGRPDTLAVVFDPHRIRRTGAQFDPAKKNSADLLAGLGAGAFFGNLLQKDDEEQFADGGLTRLERRVRDL